MLKTEIWNRIRNLSGTTDGTAAAKSNTTAGETFVSGTHRCAGTKCAGTRMQEFRNRLADAHFSPCTRRYVLLASGAGQSVVQNTRHAHASADSRLIT